MADAAWSPPAETLSGPIAANDDANWSPPPETLGQDTSGTGGTSVGGMVQAAGSGLTSGIADVAGLPVDTARKALEVGKAAVGSAVGAATSKETTPANETLTPEGNATKTSHGLYHYIDPTTGADTFSKTPPPAGAQPYTHQTVSIPSFLQPTPDAQDIGGSASIKAGLDAAGAAIGGTPTSATQTQEDTPVNRVLHSAGEGAAGALLTPEVPITGALSGAAGGAASQTTREAGGGPVAQTLAGLAAGTSVAALPAAAAGATRLAVRGGAEGQAAMQANIANAENAGVNLSVGAASGNKAIQKLESASGAMFGGGPIAANREANAAAVGNRIDDIVDRLAPSGDVSPTGAGNAVNEAATSAKGNMRAAEKAAYAKVDAAVPPQTPVDVSAPLAKLDDLTTPKAGAEATTGALVSPKVKELRDNLYADAAANAAPPPATPKAPYIAEPGTIPPPSGAPTEPPLGEAPKTLPYEGVAAVRSALGSRINWGYVADPATRAENAQMIQAHSALTDALNTTAAAQGPAAQQAVAEAKALYAKNQATRDTLNTVVNKVGGEKIYQAALSGSDKGASTLNQVMGVLNPDQANLMRATVLDQMGRGVPSSQTTAAADQFNAGTFMTNYSKMSPKAKDALFGKVGGASDLRASLDSLVDTLGVMKGSSDALKNPSGTAPLLGRSAGLAAIYEGIQHAMQGHLATGAAIGGAVASNAILSHVLTNPGVAKWLAASTQLPAAAQGNAIMQLQKYGDAKNDPDAKDLAAYLQQQGAK